LSDPAGESELKWVFGGVNVAEGDVDVRSVIQLGSKQWTAKESWKDEFSQT